MAKYTMQMNRKLEATLEELAERRGIPKAQVIRNALALLKIADEQAEEGYRLALVKDGEVEREIIVA